MATHQLPSVRVAAVTDIGRVRRENQDAVLLARERGMFVLADGMGGGPAGALAASLSVEQLPTILERELAATGPRGSGDELFVRQALGRSLGVLNSEIRQRGAATPTLTGMGAAVVLVLLRGLRAHIANLGDSRAYLVQGDELRQVTADHNLAALLVRLRQIPSEDARTHPGRNRLTQYVGMDGEVEPEIHSLSLTPGDRLLLCSDGLTGMLQDSAILSILRRTSDAEQACEELVSAANKAGGLDNISVLIIEVAAKPTLFNEA